MACEIPYIRAQQISETEKSRLEGIHIDIFKRAKESKAFREVAGRFQAIKNKYAEATSFIGSVNTQYEAPISKLNPIGGGNAVLSVNVLPLSSEGQKDLFYNLDTPEVQYALKSVSILQSPKAIDVFKKGAKNNWPLDKILQELQIPKDQQEIIKSLGTKNREEILTSLLAANTYTVEINTAKFKKFRLIPSFNDHEEGFEHEGFFYNRDMDNADEGIILYSKHPITDYDIQIPITEQAFTEAAEKQGLSEKENNTQHYARLTVPGGTNYAENEIATPAITPSIKGHAAFATENGIGWFRSDDKTNDKLTGEVVIDEQYSFGLDGQPETKEVEIPITSDKLPTKTRRILEVQSDLFQKGREKEDLISKPASEPFGDFGDDTNIVGQAVPKNETQNKFLQLLNKDNNWVSFFIKSIVQDSAKKGYETVLFPTGDTASKVEGHTTLEGLKRQKEARIHSLNQRSEYLQKKSKEKRFQPKDIKVISTSSMEVKIEIDDLVYTISKPAYNSKFNLYLPYLFSGKTYQSISFSNKTKFPINQLLPGGKGSKIVGAEEFSVTVAHKLNELERENSNDTKELKSINTEIEQIQKELQSLESGGFAALKPIYNFYENTVANILKKTYNVKKVTDEYGNTWNEISITPDVREQAILLQKKGQPQSVASESTLKKVKEIIDKMGVKIQDLVAYAKEAGLEVTNANGVADITAKVIAIAEGMEGVALTEEMVHIATQIVEQTNPKLITEMLSRIDQFKIYKEVYETYKDVYKLPNGKPDIRKIKKEAVDKLIAEIIINKNQNTDQYPELREESNVSLVRKWWNTVLDFIRGKHRATNIALFEQVAEQIMNGNIGTIEGINNSEIFFQISDQQRDSQTKILDTQKKIQKKYETVKADPLLLDSEEANNFYEVKKEDGTWERVTKRVTDRVKNWYKTKFGTKIFSDQEKKFNELKREYGVEGHADLEEIHSRYYNKDGTKKVKPDPRPSKFKLPSAAMYDKLEKYYTELIKTFPENTLIMSEVIIYDAKEKEAGTLDFLAIEPSGKAHILDWKFMGVNKGQEDVAWYKQGAYNIQITRYREILKANYGIKEFGMLRAIPILMDFQPSNPKVKNSELELKGIGIGSVDPNKIEDLKLLPVASEAESTGNDALDSIIATLNAYLKEIGQEKATTEEDRQFKLERLNTLNKAIRLAHVTQNIVPLINVIEVLRKEGDRILSDYNATYKDRPATSKDSSNSELSDFSEEMVNYIKIAGVFTEIGDDLGGLIYNEDMKKEAKTAKEKEELALRKDFLAKLNEESTSIRKSQKAIKKVSEDFANKHVGERNLVTGLLKPEKIVKGLGSLFRGVSDLPLRSLEILYKLTRSAQGKASEAALKEIQTLETIRKKIVAKGGDTRKFVQQIYQKDDKGGLVNKLIHKYQKKFGEEVDAHAEAGGSKQWLKDNIDIEAYKKEAAEVMERQINHVKKTRHAGTEEQEEAIRDAEIKKIKRQYDIDRQDFNGWNNYVLKRHPQDKWLSEEYITISKDQDLLDLYNFIVRFNEEKAKEVGYIQNTSAKTFLPFIRKTMAEEMAFDNAISPIKRAQEALELKAEDTGYGRINAVTGELENGIPKYYTHDFSQRENGVNDYSDVSEDLFKNMILYIQQVEKYKYLTEVEGQLKLVKNIEEFKGHLNTGRTGNVIVKDDKVQALGVGIEGGNSENAKLFNDFLRVMMYDQKYVLSDTDTPLQIGKAINFVKKQINAVAGKEVWKENEEANPSSLIKTIDAANRAFQLKTLGFEFISGAVNAFGGNIQVMTQAGSYFKSGEFFSNEMKLSTQRFANEDEKQIFAELVNTFMPMKDDPAYDIWKEAGLSTLTKGSISDTLFVFMRKPEQLIEKSIFLSLLQNTMVVEGKIVSIPEFVKNKYKGRYSNSAQYEQAKPKIEAEIEELKKTSSIAVTRKLENGKLVIPGLNLENREELQRLTDLTRRISRNATGGMSDGDINRASMSIWTKSMMVFKNWIPKLAYTRFDSFHKVSDDFNVTINSEGKLEGQKYDIGRIRLLAYILSDGITKGVQNLNNIMQLNQGGIERLDSLFEEFRIKYETETGETLNMSKEDFVDLIRTNLQNQLRELAVLGALFGTALSLGFIAPEDDEDKAAKNAHRYALRVVDKFVSELSFFYNPKELESMLSGGIFPALGLVKDFERFTSHFFMQITGIDFDSDTTFEEARKKAQPIKYAMKMAPVTKSLVTYLGILSDDFAREYEVTIQAESSR